MEGLEGLCVYGYSGLIDIFFHAYCHDSTTSDRSSSFYTIGPPLSTPSVLLFLHHRSSSFYTIGPPLSTPSVLLFLHHRSSSFYTIGPPLSTPSVLLFLHHRSSPWGDRQTYRFAPISSHQNNASCHLKKNLSRSRITISHLIGPAC